MKYIDIHSHILPFMDDGAKNMEMSLAMLRIAQAEGISDIILTPHYRQGRFKGDRREMERILVKLRKLLAEEQISIRLHPGNEIYYRSELEEKLESGTLSSLNDSGYVLIEFSPAEDFLYIRSAVEELFSIGYTPVIAHVERIQCIARRIDHARTLKKMGCELQINASSVTGEVGFFCKHFVHKLLKETLVDYIGTDAHNVDHRPPRMKKCAELLYRKYDREYIDNILYENAASRLLRGNRQNILPQAATVYQNEEGNHAEYR